MLGRTRPGERSSRRLARGARHIRTRVFTGHRQPHRVTNFLVGAARSLGVGRAPASAQATSGPGKKVESRRDLIFYKRLQLLVDYVGERVKGVQTSSTIYETTPVVDECQTVRNFGLADSFNEFVHAMRSYHRQCKSGSYMGGADGNGAVHRNPVHCHRFERELDGVRFRRAGYGNSVLPRNHRRREVPTRKSRVSAGGLAVVSAPVRVLCAGRRRTRFRQPQFRPGSVGPPCSAQDCESVQAAYLPQPCSPADPRRARIHADGNTVRPPFKDCTAVISPGSPAAGDGYPTGGDVGR
jgi:hypothetical protein